METIPDFIRQVPDPILKQTKVCPCGGMVLFKPTVYMGGTSFQVTDYHVVLPSEDTPAALFNDHMMRIEPRSILAVNPGDSVVCLTNASAKPYYSLLIPPEFLHKIAGEMGFFGEVHFDRLLNPFSPALYQLLKSVECECDRPDPMNLLLDSLAVQISVLLLRDWQSNLPESRLPSGEADGSFVHTAVNLMRENLSSNLHLEDICREIHVSRYYFIRTFVRETGFTPHRYLLMLRVGKAKELLKTGKYSVLEIAGLCGFESASHFSSVFKKMTGISPLQYRNQ